MANKQHQESIDLNLQGLENQVEELISACALLKDENKTLRASQDKLSLERSKLIEKTELARARVEAMIGRLKTLEVSQQ